MPTTVFKPYLQKEPYCCQKTIFWTTSNYPQSYSPISYSHYPLVLRFTTCKAKRWIRKQQPRDYTSSAQPQPPHAYSYDSASSIWAPKDAEHRHGIRHLFLFSKTVTTLVTKAKEYFPQKLWSLNEVFVILLRSKTDRSPTLYDSNPSAYYTLNHNQ
jgi:hypothetical protein